MKHIIRIQLEHKDNVIRDIEILPNKSLADLHYAIIKSLKIENNEIASFYMTNEKLELLKEIPIFKIDEKDNTMLDMSQVTISSVFPKINSQLIYIYDFLKMWRFLISYHKKSETKKNITKTINSIGEMPKEAPIIVFKTKKETEALDNDIEFEEDFSENFDAFNESEH